eukprot:Gb_14988 [translate_table: standard]
MSDVLNICYIAASRSNLESTF